jgi:hypothetical protein
MITEAENTMTLTGNRALVTERATQNESDPALGVRRPEMTVPLHCLPVADATDLELYDYVFAPWVRMLGLREFKVSWLHAPSWNSPSDPRPRLPRPSLHHPDPAAPDVYSSSLSDIPVAVPRQFLTSHTG